MQDTVQHIIFDCASWLVASTHVETKLKGPLNSGNVTELKAGRVLKRLVRRLQEYWKGKKGSDRVEAEMRIGRNLRNSPAVRIILFREVQRCLTGKTGGYVSQK